jgi:hypothetical protein
MTAYQTLALFAALLVLGGALCAIDALQARLQARAAMGRRLLDIEHAARFDAHIPMGDIRASLAAHETQAWRDQQALAQRLRQHASPKGWDRV